MRNADLIVAALRIAGIERGFGIPSGPVLPIMEAMRLGGIDFVLMAHEGSAGFAADVTARLTRTPGLCLATLGPGATNIATGVGSAYMDRSPLLAITCNLRTDQLGRRIQMSIDHHALFAPITKASLPLRSGDIVPTLQKAVQLALSEPQGPVHLDLPEDVATAEATEVVPSTMPGANWTAAPARHEIAAAQQLISGARRPIAVIGASATRMTDYRVLSSFLEAYRIPFATTTMAKGLIDEDHALSIGCIERGRRQLQRKFLQQADLIVGIGYDPIEVEYEVWAGGVPIIHVDIEAPDHDQSIEIRRLVIGDLYSALSQLSASGGSASTWTVDEIRSHRNDFQKALRSPEPELSPSQVIDAARVAVPRDAILAFDVGAHTHQIASQWRAHSPKTFLITNGWSSMGFGLPAAIAAKLQHPDKTVIGIIGDGCFQMTCGELAVAQRLGLSIPIVVLNDQELALIRIKQLNRAFEPYGVKLCGPSAVAPATSYFGVPVVQVSRLEEVRTALSAALSASGPTVIEALVNPKQYCETVLD